jgi:glycerol-3-phosphate O-acyltransferase
MVQIVERKRDVFQPSVAPRVDYKNVLMLSYYRNALLHLFANEAILAVALSSFGTIKVGEVKGK